MLFREFKIKCLKSFELSIWKNHAKQIGASEYKISGVQVICKLKSHELIKDALTKIEKFDPTAWKRLTSSLKMIIFIEKGESGIIAGKGVALISINSQGHVSTSTHLASWLLYYSEMLHGVEEVGLVNWLTHENASVRERARALRKSFIAGAPPRSAESATIPTD